MRNGPRYDGRSAVALEEMVVGRTDEAVCSVEAAGRTRAASGRSRLAEYRASTPTAATAGSNMRSCSWWPARCPFASRPLPLLPLCLDRSVPLQPPAALAVLAAPVSEHAHLPHQHGSSEGELAPVPVEFSRPLQFAHQLYFCAESEWTGCSFSFCPPCRRQCRTCSK